MAKNIKAIPEVIRRHIDNSINMKQNEQREIDEKEIKRFQKAEFDKLLGGEGMLDKLESKGLEISIKYNSPFKKKLSEIHNKLVIARYAKFHELNGMMEKFEYQSAIGERLDLKELIKNIEAALAKI